MFISKVRRKESGILLYGITPPKVHTSPERVTAIAQRTISTLSACDIDALVVYDVQDESSRTNEERPFPFINALDPFEYARMNLQSLTIPKIIYRPAGMFAREDLTEWLQGLSENQFYPIFVGLPSPDSVPLTTLSEAYNLWRTKHADHSVLGAVMIPERHAVLHDEPARMLDKMNGGVSYFITQCIFNVDYTKNVLDDLVNACRVKSADIPVVIFTLTICGSSKTLEFMEWLGIYVPADIRARLEASAAPVTCSVDIARAIARELVDYCHARSIPFGFNIESVATRKEEVDGSLELLSHVQQILKQYGLRNRDAQMATTA